VVTARSASSDSRIRRASDFRLRSSTTRRIPASLEPLLLDSGGFTELKHHGRWRSTAAEFVAEIRTLVDRLGRGRGRDLAAGLDVRGGRHQWRPHQGTGLSNKSSSGGHPLFAFGLRTAHAWVGRYSCGTSFSAADRAWGVRVLSTMLSDVRPFTDRT
jgi:hypothetical protein